MVETRQASVTPTADNGVKFLLRIARYKNRAYNLCLETRNSKLETRNSKLETRNSKLETRNSKLETRNSKLAIILSANIYPFAGHIHQLHG